MNKYVKEVSYLLFFRASFFVQLRIEEIRFCDLRDAVYISILNGVWLFQQL